jgi:hypothetical protein
VITSCDDRIYVATTECSLARFSLHSGRSDVNLPASASCRVVTPEFAFLGSGGTVFCVSRLGCAPLDVAGAYFRSAACPARLPRSARVAFHRLVRPFCLRAYGPL